MVQQVVPALGTAVPIAECLGSSSTSASNPAPAITDTPGGRDDSSYSPAPVVYPSGKLQMEALAWAIADTEDRNNTRKISLFSAILPSE